MIQFFGLAFSDDTVSGTILGRDLNVTAERSTPIAGGRRSADGAGPISIPSAEWTRAASYLTHELFLDLPVSDRKVWGLALSSPPGWIGLDLEYEALTPVRLLPAADIAADIRSWREENSREAKRLLIVLSPKDYFRFCISGALATDATQASAQSLVKGDGTQWSAPRLKEEGLEEGWLPPIFDSATKTGQISPQGTELAGLPGGLWLATGALDRECARIGLEDRRSTRLAFSETCGLISYGLDRCPSVVPPGMRARRAAYAGHWVLETADSWASESDAPLSEIQQTLESAGYSVERAISKDASPSLGAASIAAVSSGLIRDWDEYYKRLVK